MQAIKYLLVIILLADLASLIPCAHADDECSQDLVCITDKRKGDDVLIFAHNTAAFDVTLELKLELENMRPRGSRETQFVVLANSKTQLVKLRPINIYQQAHYRYSTTWVRGDVNVQHDDSAVYQLPYAIGKTYYVSQSCDGNLSHDVDYSRYAVDFAMPLGTPINAARGGQVVDLYQESIYEEGSTLHYDDANFVQVLHNDGTIGGYYHLRTMGVAVAIGDRVTAGQFIAYSGNTGYSYGPHLHFHVQKPISASATVSIQVNWKSVSGILSCPKTGLVLKAVAVGAD